MIWIIPEETLKKAAIALLLLNIVVATGYSVGLASSDKIAINSGEAARFTVRVYADNVYCNLTSSVPYAEYSQEDFYVINYTDVIVTVRNLPNGTTNVMNKLICTTGSGQVGINQGIEFVTHVTVNGTITPSQNTSNTSDTGAEQSQSSPKPRNYYSSGGYDTNITTEIVPNDEPTNENISENAPENDSIKNASLSLPISAAATGGGESAAGYVLAAVIILGGFGWFLVKHFNQPVDIVNELNVVPEPTLQEEKAVEKQAGDDIITGASDNERLGIPRADDSDNSGVFGSD